MRVCKAVKPVPRPSRPAFVTCSMKSSFRTASHKSWVWRPGNEAIKLPGGNVDPSNTGEK